MTEDAESSDAITTISIHILHTKDDSTSQSKRIYSTISIHILHTKDDFWYAAAAWSSIYFNPHPSYEGWLYPVHCHLVQFHFNPHPSYEGWLDTNLQLSASGYFNPHPSYEGWHSWIMLQILSKSFQSTSFIRRMTYSDLLFSFYCGISIHILHTKDDALSLTVPSTA